MRSFPILMLGLATLLIQPLVSVCRRRTDVEGRPGRAITGKVTDATRQAACGRQLELQNSAGKTVAKAKSDAEGRFTFAGVAPGVYAIVASKASFKPATAIVSVDGIRAQSL